MKVGRGFNNKVKKNEIKIILWTKIVTSYKFKVGKKNLESPTSEINKNKNDSFYDLILTFWTAC